MRACAGYCEYLCKGFVLGVAHLQNLVMTASHCLVCPVGETIAMAIAVDTAWVASAIAMGIAVDTTWVASAET